MPPPFCCATKSPRPATGCGSRLSAASRTATASERRSRSRPRDQPAIRKFAPEVVSKVRAIRALFSAWARRRKLTPSSFGGRADMWTRWGRWRRIRNSSFERESVEREPVEREPVWSKEGRIRGGERHRRHHPSHSSNHSKMKCDETTEFGSPAQFDLPLLIVQGVISDVNV